jgi:RecB family endonuclease NucS
MCTQLDIHVCFLTTALRTLHEALHALSMEEEFEDIKVAIKILKSKKDSHHNDIKVAIRIRKSKKDSHHNDQMKKYKRDKQRSTKQHTET